jgi:UTP--glucose-1-phosphate uridylyltransferase
MVSTMSKLTKLVIPVAGLGTRVLPASKVIPKEMLTVVDRPVIQYVVEEAVAAGFTQIIFVTSDHKNAIEDHFDSLFELEVMLERKGKHGLIESIKDIAPPDVTLCSVRQHHPLGLGHAVLCAAPLIGDDPFAVSLPDVLLYHRNGDYSHDLKNMVAEYDRNQEAQFMVEQVPQNLVSSYGIVDCNGVEPDPGKFIDIVDMVEKPPINEAPSNLSITGRYILPPRLMELLKETAPGAGGEIQLTDAIHKLLQEAPVKAYALEGTTYDCGDKLGFLRANVRFGLSHPELGEDFREIIKEFSQNEL